MITTTKSWEELTSALSVKFGERASRHDAAGTFVSENYADLKAHRYFAALIPTELGGEGLSHGEMCEQLCILGQQCPSTALALSMHSHLVGANVWKYKKGHDVATALRKIAENQPILVSTGAKDWLESNGEMTKVEGGYLVNGLKHFASQAAIGDVMITSSVHHHPEEGAQVLHFPIPFQSEGVSVLNNWDTLGMRGTGSHSIRLENVFVPESAIVLARGKGEFHPVWNVVLTVAMPLIMSVYVGIAQRAFQIAKVSLKKIDDPRDHAISALARLSNELTTAQLNWQDMIRLNNNFDFEPNDEIGHLILTRKTNVARTVINVVTQATELVGGSSYFKANPLERLFRDVQGAKYHPLNEVEQLLFSGKHLLSA